MITNTLPLMNVIHANNHTHYQRVGMIDSYHSSLYDTSFKDLIYNPASIPLYNNLVPGIYRVELDSVSYYFDLFVYVSQFDSLYINKGRLEVIVQIKSSTNKIYIIPMYKYLSTPSSTLANTFNATLGMVIFNGATTITGNGTYDSPAKLVPRNSIAFNTSGDGKSNTKTIKLTQNLRRLPDGKHDLGIFNADRCLMHYIINVGCTTIKGSEVILHMENFDTTNYAAFFVPIIDIAMSSNTTNMRCSHAETVQYSAFGSVNKACVAVNTNADLGNGILIKLPKSILEYDPESETILVPLKEWLTSQVLNSTPFVVEYTLKETKYPNDLLEDYDIPTYYSSTTFKVNNSTTFDGISIFYNKFS